ncbi:MAG: two-component regulator propeller domain-containing protein [Bacteroidota bacterium]
MNKRYFFGLVVGLGLLLVGCQFRPSVEELEMPKLYEGPQLVSLDTATGYRQNMVTGLPVPTLINSLGDTVVTGKRIALQSLPLAGPALTKIASRRAKPTQEVKAFPNRFAVPISGEAPSLPFEAVRELPFGEAYRDFTLTLTNGDTLATGVPLPINFDTVPFPLKVTGEAMPFRFRDVAQYNLQYLDVGQGLHSSYIFSMLQDSRGDLWFGSDAAGAVRYDGNSFIAFSKEEGLRSNFVQVIFEDDEGRIWLGTRNGGISVYDGKNIVHVLHGDSDIGYVRSIDQDVSGNIWLGTRKGLVRVEGNTITFLTTQEGLLDNSVQDLEVDPEGGFWLATPAGLCHYDGEVFRHYPPADQRPAVLHLDLENRLWVAGASSGVQVVDLDQAIQYQAPPTLDSMRIRVFAQDTLGQIWMGTQGDGLVSYHQDQFNFISEESGLNHPSVLSIVVSKDGILWLGTDGGGVNRLNLASFSFVTEKEGLSNERVFPMLEDQKGSLWLGTQFGGVTQFDGQQYRQFYADSGFPITFVRSSAEDKEGNLWFGGRNGQLVRYDGTQFHEYTLSNPDWAGQAVEAILVSSTGEVWLGIRHRGVVRVSEEATFYYSEEQGLPGNDVNAIIEDQEGRIWVAFQEGGLTCLDGDTLLNLSEREGMATHREIYSIFQDSRGIIWIGTAGWGAIAFDGQTFFHYSADQGLTNAIAWTVGEDAQGNIWVGTERGLTLLALSEGVGFPAYTPIVYGDADGLLATDFLYDTYLDQNQRMWWGTGKALVSLDLAKWRAAEERPLLRLQNLLINEDFVNFHAQDLAVRGLQYEEVIPYANTPQGLELSHDLNTLTFQFSTLHWSAPNQLQYSFFLQGRDTRWSNPTHSNVPVYRNLPPGQYTLYARVVGREKTWSDLYQFDFTIRYPWWEQWWAIVGYLCIFLVALFGAFRWRTAQIRKQKNLLEELVDVRTQELARSNQKLIKQNAEITQQREQIAEQKEEIEVQKVRVETAHEELTASISHAQRIQNALLTSEKLWARAMDGYFILNKPKEVVSGDFYWAYETEHYFFWAVADCTGHGVPGAMMSMLGITFLKEVVVDSMGASPGKILDRIREKFEASFEGQGLGIDQEGMDISFCAWDRKQSVLHLAGAFNPVILIRSTAAVSPEGFDKTMAGDQHALYEYKTDRMSVGKGFTSQESFVTRSVALQPGDVIVLYTDGFQDQFGGPKERKFMGKRLKQLLLEVQQFPVHQQSHKIEQTFEEWMSTSSIGQIDDVCLVGVKI